MMARLQSITAIKSAENHPIIVSRPILSVQGFLTFNLSGAACRKTSSRTETLSDRASCFKVHAQPGMLGCLHCRLN